MGGAQSCSELKQIAEPKPKNSDILTGVSISKSQSCTSGNCSRCQPGDDRGKCCDPCSLIIPASVSSSSAVLMKMTTDALEEKCPSDWKKQGGRSETLNLDGYCVSRDDGNIKVNFGKGIFGKSTKLLITPSIPFPVSFNGSDYVINNLSLYWPSPVRIENVQHDAMLSLNDASMGDKFIILVPLVSSGIVGDSGDFVGKITPYIGQVLSDSRPDKKLKADIVTGAGWDLTKVIPVGDNSKVKIPYYTWESVEYIGVDKSTPVDKMSCVQRFGWKKADNPTRYILLTEAVKISPTDLAAIKLLPPTDPNIAIEALGAILYQNAPPADCKTCKTPLAMLAQKPEVSTDMFWTIFGIVLVVLLFSIGIFYGAKFAVEKDWRSIYTKIGDYLAKPFQGAAVRTRGVEQGFIPTAVVGNIPTAEQIASATGPTGTIQQIITSTATGPTGTIQQIITSTATGPTGTVQQITTTPATGPTGTITTADEIARATGPTGTVIPPGAGVGLDEITTRPRADSEILPEITTTGPLETILGPAAERTRTRRNIPSGVTTTRRQPLKREVGSRSLVPTAETIATKKPETDLIMSTKPTAEEIARLKAKREAKRRRLLEDIAKTRRAAKQRPDSAFTMAKPPTAEEIARGKAEREEKQRKISREAERRRTAKAPRKPESEVEKPKPRKPVTKEEVQRRDYGQFKAVVSPAALRKRSAERAKLPEKVKRVVPAFEDISPAPAKKEPDTFKFVNPMPKSKGLLSRSKVQADEKLEAMKKEQERIKKSFEERQTPANQVRPAEPVTSAVNVQQRKKMLEDAQKKQAEMRQALKDRPVLKKRNVDLSGGRKRKRTKVNNRRRRRF